MTAGRRRRWAAQTDEACSGQTFVQSFRGSAAGREPGIHNHRSRSMDSGLASASLRRPGMTRLTKVDKMAKTKANTGTHDAAPRAWQRMLSGRRLDLLDPSPPDIEIEVIAQALARWARGTCQTHGSHFFSGARQTLRRGRMP